MRPTMAIASWMAKMIHPPLPLTARESQKLLSSLQASFREQLDQRPSSRPKDAPPVSGLKRPAKTHQHGRKKHSPAPDPRSSTFQSSHMADHHIQSILSNPLFSLGGPSHQPPPRKASRSRTAGRTDIFNGSHNVARFRAAVAAGRMTPDRARGFLQAEQRRCMAESAASTRAEGLRQSCAPREVLRWIESSSQAETLEFLRNRDFVEILAQFLVAEGRVDVLSAWMVAPLSPSSLDDHESLSAGPVPSQQFVLNLLVEAEAQWEEHGADAPFEHFLNAYRAWDGDRWKAAGGGESPLDRAAVYLAQMCTVQGRWPSATTLDAFLRTYGEQLRSTLLAAELALYRPDRERRTWVVPGEELLRRFEELSGTERSGRMVRLWLDTAREMLERGEELEGGRLLLRLEKLWPSLTGWVSMGEMGEGEGEGEEMDGVGSPSGGMVERLYRESPLVGGADEL